MDDLVLIQAFIQASIAAKEVLLSNSKLKAETVCHTNQLLSTKEGLLATVKIDGISPRILIRRNTSYWPMLNQTLVEQHYIPIGKVHNQDFLTYQYYKVPDGYKLCCTTTSELWKVWWRYSSRRLNSRYGIPIEILLWNQRLWCPIQDLSCNNGAFAIKLPGSETLVAGTDLAIWLMRIAKVDMAKQRDYSYLSLRTV